MLLEVTPSTSVSIAGLEPTLHSSFTVPHVGCRRSRTRTDHADVVAKALESRRQVPSVSSRMCGFAFAPRPRTRSGARLGVAEGIAETCRGGCEDGGHASRELNQRCGMVSNRCTEIVVAAPEALCCASDSTSDAFEMLPRCAGVNAGIRRRSRAYMTQFLHSPIFG